MEDFMSRPQNEFLRLRSVTRVMTAAFQVRSAQSANRLSKEMVVSGFAQESRTEEAKSVG